MVLLACLDDAIAQHWCPTNRAVFLESNSTNANQSQALEEPIRYLIGDLVHLHLGTGQRSGLLYARAVVLLSAANDALAANDGMAAQRAVFGVGDLINLHLGLRELAGALVARSVVL